MIDYKGLYLKLFSKLSDVLDALEEQNYGVASKLIRCTLLEAEEDYITESEPK